MLHSKSFFDLSTFAHPAVFAETEYVWDVLKELKSYMNSVQYPTILKTILANRPLPETLIYFEDNLLPLDNEIELTLGDATKGKIIVKRHGIILKGASVIMAGAVLDGGAIKIGKGVLIESGAMLKSPTILGDNTEVRQGAYLRGYCLTGDRCVLGHVTEIKHTIFLDDAKAGHFAYLGDSILGNQVNLGAGTKMANLRFTGGDVPVKTKDGIISSGLRKFGAILGDNVQTGCNSVTNPGTLLGKKSMLLPNTTAPSGYHANSSLIRP